MKFGRGYGEFREKGKYNKYTMSCENCDSYYQDVGDDEELCQDPNVLEYDIVHNERSTYCLHWKPVNPKHNRGNSGFKNGVKIGGRKKKVQKTRSQSRKTSKR